MEAATRYNNIMKKWRSGEVQHGDQTGRTLGFPTANFAPTLARDIKKDGVYAATVIYDGKSYLGALYLGPRITLHETRRVLEIHLLDFTGNLYGQTLSFSIGKFIRPPRDFSSQEALQRQLADDVAAVRAAFV